MAGSISTGYIACIFSDRELELLLSDSLYTAEFIEFVGSQRLHRRAQTRRRRQATCCVAHTTASIAYQIERLKTMRGS
ncbi:unnamed protein product [Trichogramma brassicae]|uniref:Uncharacterized protein n=1 Tax=Trichogramma brassicae TaxID=86971 RepID=A0A6H5J3U1_9HYME|nr:unnamed protein product [Trichogramma brassicae]